MTTDNGNQSAFPSGKELYKGIDNFGLTKREYLAAMAMQGILAADDKDLLKFSFEQALPKLAVMYADELLKQLSKP
jgi:hypothetical protein